MQNVWKCVVLGCFTLACSGQAALAQDANMEKAMTAAFGSKEIKKLKVKGHEFNVKPIKSENVGGAMKVSGQISHHRTLQDDDQVYYSFTIRADGTVEGFDVNIERSLMRKVVGFVWDEFLKELLADESTSDGESGTDSTEQAVTLAEELSALEGAIKLAEEKIGAGKWEKSAAAIVANVMIRAKTSTSARSSRVYDRVNYLRRAVKRNSGRPAARPAIVRPFGVADGVTSTDSGAYVPQVRDRRSR